MALLEILPSASIAHHNGTTVVFSLVLMCFANHSSWETEECLPVVGILLGRHGLPLGFGLVDKPEWYGEGIWEFFIRKCFSCEEKLVLGFGTSTASYGEDIWESEYGEAVPLPSKRKVSYSSYGFDNWEYEFFPFAFPSCKEDVEFGENSENLLADLLVRIHTYTYCIGLRLFYKHGRTEELVASPGSRTAWHRENIWEASMALPGILSSAPVAQQNGTSDFIIDFTGFWESGCMASENSSCTEENLFGHGVYVRVGTASRLVDRVNINETMFNIKLWFLSFIGILGPLILEFLASIKAKYHHRKSLKSFLRPTSPRFPVINDLRVKLSWAACLQILGEIASGAIYQYQHKMYQRGGYGTSVHTRNRDSQQSLSSSAMRAFSWKELNQATNSFNQLLGKGSFGEVYKGTMRWPHPHAIAEKSIGRIYHRNLVRMIDYCIEGKHQMLVFEPEKRLPWRQRAEAAIRIARGLEYLHDGCSAPIIHRDIKPANILMDGRGIPRITDFGISELLGSRQVHTTVTHVRGTGSPVMHAPRYLRLVYGNHPGFSRAEYGNKELKTKTSSTWVAATAAPHHATGNADLFSGFVIEHDAQFVHAADGVPRKVIARGAVITDTVVLPDVWFVAGLKENLVSVSQLADLDHTIGFGRGECCIRSARDDKIVGKGHLQKGGHYVLDFLKVPLAI